MTDEEWKKVKRNLTYSVTRAKSKLMAAESLADKVAAKREVKEAEGRLHNHKLHYYDLTRRP